MGWALFVGVGVVALAGRAHAQDSAAAEQVFLEAKKLSEDGEWAAACPKFEASLRLDRTLGTLLNLADCNEHIGKVASSWSQFQEASEWATREGDERAGYAAERRDALAARLPRLTITVDHPVQTLSVYREDVFVGPAAFGVATPVDPGPVVITVRRGETELARRETSLAEGATATIALDLAQIDRDHPAPATPPPSQVVVMGAPQPDYWNGQRVIGLVVASAGFVGLVNFGVLEVLAISKQSEAETDGPCVDGRCSPEGTELVSDAETLAEVGQWVGIASGAVFLLGATLFITAPSPDDAAPRDAGARASLWASPFAGPTGGGLAVGGRL